jgi:hypothetical protein
MLYNCTLTIWQSAAKAYRTYPNGGPRLEVFDGMVGDGHNVLARFLTQRDALTVLKRAGFTKQVDGTFKA